MIIIIKAELFMHLIIYGFIYLCMHVFIYCETTSMPIIQFLKNMTLFVQMRECSINHLVIFVAQKLASLCICEW